jgi:hypothetical protein
MRYTYRSWRKLHQSASNRRRNRSSIHAKDPLPRGHRKPHVRCSRQSPVALTPPSPFQHYPSFLTTPAACIGSQSSAFFAILPALKLTRSHIGTSAIILQASPTPTGGPGASQMHRHAIFFIDGGAVWASKKQELITLSDISKSSKSS